MAAPSISGISGTATEGNTLTISGTGFLTRSTTTGVFDTFDDNSFDGYWADNRDLTLTSNNQRSANSSYQAFTNITSHATSDGSLKGGSTVARSWYVSYWWKVSDTWDWGTSSYLGTDKFLANVKLWRMWNPGAFTEDVYMQYKGNTNAVEFVTEGMNDELTESVVGSARTALTLDTWHQFRIQFVDSSAAGNADCSVKIWYDGGDVDYTYNGTCQEDESGFKRPFIAGFQNEWSCTEGTPDTEGCGDQTLYIDDVVAFDSIARVEICDNATYSACSHAPEFQPITSWSDTSIDITYSLGSMTGTVYAFVVDNTGAVSSGYEVGSAPDPSPSPGANSMAGGFSISGGVTVK